MLINYKPSTHTHTHTHLHVLRCLLSVHFSNALNVVETKIWHHVFHILKTNQQTIILSKQVNIAMSV